MIFIYCDLYVEKKATDNIEGFYDLVFDLNRILLGN